MSFRKEALDGVEKLYADWATNDQPRKIGSIYYDKNTSTLF